jgi:hypothetical protein
MLPSVGAVKRHHPEGVRYGERVRSCNVERSKFLKRLFCRGSFSARSRVSPRLEKSALEEADVMLRTVGAVKRHHPEGQYEGGLSTENRPHVHRHGSTRRVGRGVFFCRRGGRSRCRHSKRSGPASWTRAQIAAAEVVVAHSWSCDRVVGGIDS